VYWYYSHPRPAREWAEIQLPQIGIKATLSTRWSDDYLHYQFHVSPTARTEIAEFDKAIQTKSQPLGFSVFLGDSDGFKLCTIRIYDADLQRDLDEAGKTQGLSANGTDFCSLGKYNQASKWSVSWEYFPTVVVADEVSIPKGATVGQPRSGKPPAGKGKAKGDEPTHPLSDLGFKPVLPNSAPDSQGPGLWKDKSHWRMLQKGMSKNDVRKLLGEPLKIESGGPLEHWSYTGAGILGAHVTFDENGRVWGWDEP